MVAGETEAEAREKLKLVALGKVVAGIANTQVFCLRQEPAPLNSTIDSCQRRQSWVRKMHAGVVCFLASYSSPSLIVVTICRHQLER